MLRAFCSPPPPPPSASHTAAEPARKALGGRRHARGGVRLEAASTSHMSQCWGDTRQQPAQQRVFNCTASAVVGAGRLGY